jgi:hypothetical protein
MEIITFLASIILITFAVFRTYLLLSSSTWNITRGKVIQFSTYHDHEYNLWPQIKYSYNVGGIEYIGNRIFAGGMWGIFGWYKWIDDLKAEYQDGFSINVLYNPKRPSLSCLKRGHWGAIIGLYFGGILFVLGTIKLF